MDMLSLQFNIAHKLYIASIDVNTNVNDDNISTDYLNSLN